MKANKIFRMMAVTAVSSVVLASCNNAAPKMDEQPTDNTSAAAAGEVKIAYVEVDSLMSQYQFCKDFTLVLQKKGNNARNTLTAKQKQLQTAAANFQQKVQNNGFQSREQAAGAQYLKVSPIIDTFVCALELAAASTSAKCPEY